MQACACINIYNIQHACVRWEMHTEFQSENLKEGITMDTQP